MTAQITTGSPIGRVTAATLEWGYDNAYRYHWAGRADAAASAGNDSLLTAGQVGTNYGSERETRDWVCVQRVDLQLATDEFAEAAADFRVPSWAPGSSSELVRWGCRLLIARRGRDIDARGEFVVVIGASDAGGGVEVAGPPPATERYWGDGATDVELLLSESVFVAGQTISGEVVLQPRSDLPEGDLAVSAQLRRDFHPLERYPAQTTEADRRIVQLGKKIPLRAGGRTVLPFEVPLPADAAPSGQAVHSSVSWSIAARLMYAGFSGPGIERVRRPIVVVNAV
ncbi:sporulation protein [Gordonia soli]|uniref:sporulation protein n=1 Tax=Gordonia soli TaxID=320799 RepID=UPI001FE08D19|nr:sporulation protein [Gordonia soli]